MGENNTNHTEFVKLLTSHQLVLRSFIVSLIPGSPSVEDILQDVNVILWQKRDDFTLGSNFRSWAFTVAHNVTRSFLRKHKNEQSTRFNEETINLILQSQEEQPESHLSSKQAALNLCLAELTPKEARLIQARYQGDTSLEEHSKLLKRSSESLRVSLFRIRKKLKKCVQFRISVAQEA